MADITLLGPQSPEADLRSVLESRAIRGRLGVVTAGWQEREGELDALREHVANPFVDLALYARCEEAFAADRALFDAHRERQDELRAMQRFYRLRLAHALAAAHELAAAEGPEALLEAERRAADSALRALDRLHLRRIRRVHAAFEAHLAASPSAALARQRDAIARDLDGCEAVLVAGGHVAVLLGRLRLLDFAGLAAGRTVIAWSAGAMALSERVVLFHDHPPQGAGDPEVFDAGLGLCPGVVPLPHARARLALDDRVRVGVFARRFAPAQCLTLERGAVLRCRGARVVEARGVSRLGPAGTLAEALAA